MFSSEQRAVIETWGKGMAVWAGAGAGKTTTLTQKCIELLGRNPESRFVAVSFTERSAGDLREKLSQKISLDRHWVTTIHGLCGSVIREFPADALFEGEERVAAEVEARQLWNRAKESLWMEVHEGPQAEELEWALERLLEREGVRGLSQFLDRMRELASFGGLDRMDLSQEDSKALSILTRITLERYSQLKRRIGVIDFSDLEVGAARALQSVAVQQSFHRRFDLILVDEFQDTNVVQAEVLLKLAKPDLSNLCVVGDPKQSIYRFRDADVSVFEEISNRLPVRISLTKNFRSRPGVLDFVNQVCEPLFEASEMKFESLEPHREADPDLESILKLEVDSPTGLAQWILSERDRGVSIGKMALLMRKIRGNEVWLDALAAADIPLALGSGGFFWEDPRVQEMVSLLRAWDNGANTLSAATFLRAPWVGIPDLVLDQWFLEQKKSAHLNSAIEAFFKSDYPLAKRLNSIRNKVVRPGQVILELLEDFLIEQELGMSALGLWHRCEELSERGLSFSKVVREVSMSVEEQRREREVPPPQDQNQLRVLTLHSAKGLEFDHVILVDFAGKKRAGDRPWLYWDRGAGVYLASRDEEGERVEDEKENEWKAREDFKNLAESKRLFYVALTRARERAVLVFPPAKLPSKADTKANPLNQDNWRAWAESGKSGQSLFWKECLGMDQPSPIQNAEERSPPAPRGRVPIVPWIRARHSVTEWVRLAQCPRAYQWATIFPRAPIAEPDRRDYSDLDSTLPKGMSARELGTRIHSLLEASDWGGMETLEQEVGAENFLAQPLIAWVKAQEPGIQIWNELSFEFKVGEAVLVGSMDRLIQTSHDPCYRILDFKVSTRAHSADALIARYKTQLALYRYALERLDPRAARSQDQVKSEIVQISPGGVTQIVVPTPHSGDLEKQIHDLAHLAIKIAAEGGEGEPAQATPSDACRRCDFLGRCSEGQRSLL